MAKRTNFNRIKSNPLKYTERPVDESESSHTEIEAELRLSRMSSPTSQQLYQSNASLPAVLNVMWYHPGFWQQWPQAPKESLGAYSKLSSAPTGKTAWDTLISLIITLLLGLSSEGQNLFAALPPPTQEHIIIPWRLQTAHRDSDHMTGAIPFCGPTY